MMQAETTEIEAAFLAGKTDRELLEFVATVAFRLQSMLDGIAASPMAAALLPGIGTED